MRVWTLQVEKRIREINTSRALDGGVGAVAVDFGFLVLFGGLGWLELS